MASLQEQVGRRVRQLRKDQGLTQEALAAKAGLDYKHLGAIERGEKNVTMQNVERICRGLGVEPVQVFLFAASGVEAPEKINRARIQEALKRAEARVGQGVLRVLSEILRMVEGG